MHIYIETHTASFDGALFEVALQPVCPSGEKPAAFVRFERFDMSSNMVLPLIPLSSLPRRLNKIEKNMS